jgi:hypothetical protein
MAELHRLTQDKEQVEQQLDELSQTQAALKTQITYATSEPAVVRWAYEDGVMVRENDIPVVPIGGQVVATAAPTPTLAVTQEQLSNWEKWQRLFFGPQAP